MGFGDCHCDYMCSSFCTEYFEVQYPMEPRGGSFAYNLDGLFGDCHWRGKKPAYCCGTVLRSLPKTIPEMGGQAESNYCHIGGYVFYGIWNADGNFCLEFQSSGNALALIADVYYDTGQRTLHDLFSTPGYAGTEKI